MIALISSSLAVIGIIVELVRSLAPRSPSPGSSLGSKYLIPILLTVAIIALEVQPLVGLVSGIAGLILVIRTTRHASARVSSSMSAAWPQVLDETAMRIANLGDSLPVAFLTAATTLPKPFDDLVEAAAKNFQLNGDFSLSLQQIEAQLGVGTGSDTLRMLASLTGRSSSEILVTLETLAKRHREEHSLAMELDAKLSGARLARAFVVAVPLFLLLVGIVIGGGLAPYMSRLGLTMATLALVIITCCWLWADHYLGPLDTRGAHHRWSTNRLVQVMCWFAP